MKITMEGKWQTRDGRPARILCTDAEDGSPVVVLVKGHVWRYAADGTIGDLPHPSDLIPAKPEPVVEWGVMDRVHGFVLCKSESEARCARLYANATAKVAKRTTEIIEP